MYDAVNKGCVQFIMDVVSETWYRELKSPTTFYTAAMSLQFFTRLISKCGGLHVNDVVAIQVSMMKLYDEAE